MYIKRTMTNVSWLKYLGGVSPLLISYNIIMGIIFLLLWCKLIGINMVHCKYGGSLFYLYGVNFFDIYICWVIFMFVWCKLISSSRPSLSHRCNMSPQYLGSGATANSIMWRSLSIQCLGIATYFEDSLSLDVLEALNIWCTILSICVTWRTRSLVYDVLWKFSIFMCLYQCQMTVLETWYVTYFEHSMSASHDILEAFNILIYDVFRAPNILEQSIS